MRADLAPRPFTYEHSYRDFHVSVTVGFREVMGLMHVTLYTNRRLSGYLGGLWIPEEDGIDFRSVAGENLSSPRRLGAKGMPRLIGATITQIVTRGIVDNWYSSNTLRPEGRDLYRNYLTQQPNLNVKYLKDRNEFLVIRRTAG